MLVEQERLKTVQIDCEKEMLYIMNEMTQSKFRVEHAKCVSMLLMSFLESPIVGLIDWVEVDLLLVSVKGRMQRPFMQMALQGKSSFRFPGDTFRGNPGTGKLYLPKLLLVC